MDRRNFLGFSTALPLLSFLKPEEVKKEEISVPVSLTNKRELEREINRENRLKTGFPTLDKALGGGLDWGSLYCVYGEAGSGKTSFIETITQHVQSPYLMICNGVMDLLIIGGREFIDFTSANSLQTPEINAWRLLGLCPTLMAWQVFADKCVRYAMEHDAILIFSKRTQSKSVNSDFDLDESFAMRRSCCAAIHLEKDRDSYLGSKATIVKNRWGANNISFPINFSLKGCYEATNGTNSTL